MKSILYTLFLCISYTLLSCNNPPALSEKHPPLKDSGTQNATVTADNEKDKLEKPYHPEENAEEKIQLLIAQAKKENKHILIQAGGNWCIWCLRFNQFRQEQPVLKQLIADNYLYYHLNYSPENKNEALFAKYGDPGKLGYPVFIILDKTGKQIHTQESGSLEDGAKSYDLQKVQAFLEAWKPK